MSECFWIVDSNAPLFRKISILLIESFISIIVLIDYLENKYKSDEETGKYQGLPTCKIIFLIFYKNRKRKLEKYQGEPTCKVIFLIFYLIAPKMIDTVVKYFLWSNSCVAKYAVLKVSLSKEFSLKSLKSIILGAEKTN